MTFKFLVWVGVGENYIVRFYPRGRESVVHQEPDLLGRCQELGLPVPAVLADSRTGPAARLDYIVYARIEGHMLSQRLAYLNESRQRRLADELTSALVNLERVRFEGRGELVSSAAADHRSWVEFVRESSRSGLSALRKHRLLDESLIEQIVSLLNATDRFRIPDDNCLVWGDINFTNILVDSSGHLTGLVDFESCLSGDPTATIGYCFAAHGNQPFCAMMVDRWSDRIGRAQRDLVLFYAIVRSLRLARYAHRALPTGRSRDPLCEIFPGLQLAIRKLATCLESGSLREEE